jgi:hypothetical protein
METKPSAFFITDHYRGSNAMLVRLSKVRASELQELIERCWRAIASKKLVTVWDGGGATPHAAGSRRRAAPTKQATR